MEPSPDESSRFDILAADIADLKRRVATLEGSGPAFLPIEPAIPQMPSVSGGAVTSLGLALLGMAGAYLLRALVESGSLPRAVGVAAGLLYAGCWLVTSSRVSSENRFTIAVYGLTSALILSPLLWETTVRFQALPSHLAAAALVLFVLIGLALAWRRNLSVIVWITTLAGLGTAFALIVATRALLPFTAALLAIAAAIEYTACRDHWLNVRWIVALGADCAVLLTTHIVTRPQGLPEGYAIIPVWVVVALQAALLATYLGSMLVRTLVRNLTVSWFEAIQAAAAFTVAIGGMLQVGHSGPAIGVSCLLAGVAAYIAAFGIEERRSTPRNFQTYATYGLLLLATGSVILFSHLRLTIMWSALAAAAVWTGLRTARNTAVIHGAAYLVAAVFVSGALGYTFDRMYGPSGAALVAAIAAALCYAATFLESHPRNDWTWKLPVTLFAAIIVAIAFGFAAAFLSAALSLDPSARSALRTALVSVAGIALAVVGLRFGRSELIWILYPTMILGALKLVAEDFRQGRPLSLFLSLLFYGGTLTLLSKLFRRSTRSEGSKI
ncbi:MAG TPA: hypothetical protein VKV15_03055 [Bryobacteraceae bacterium]|nr:hypothetical protein [Bryobacteraceae bacterium]